MRAAPPVDVTLGNGRREKATVAVVWTAACAAVAAWLDAHLPGQWLTVIAPVGALLGGAMGWRVASPMRGRLAWDGVHWSWRVAAGISVPLHGLRIALDLGGWLLLRDDAGHWCGIAAGDVQAQWHGLQLALRSALPREAAR
jgi:hypothetical protein